MQHQHVAVNRRLTRLWLAIASPRIRDERGDVPGWVLVTVVTGA